MPLMRISPGAEKPAEYRRAIAENVYESLRETFNVPENDFFATVDEFQPRDFIYDRKYFNIERLVEVAKENWSFGNARRNTRKGVSLAVTGWRQRDGQGKITPDQFGSFTCLAVRSLK